MRDQVLLAVFGTKTMCSGNNTGGGSGDALFAVVMEGCGSSGANGDSVGGGDECGGVSCSDGGGGGSGGYGEGSGGAVGGCGDESWDGDGSGSDSGIITAHQEPAINLSLNFYLYMAGFFYSNYDALSRGNKWFLGNCFCFFFNFVTEFYERKDIQKSKLLVRFTWTIHIKIQLFGDLPSGS